MVLTGNGGMGARGGWVGVLLCKLEVREGSRTAKGYVETG